MLSEGCRLDSLNDLWEYRTLCGPFLYYLSSQVDEGGAGVSCDPVSPAMRVTEIAGSSLQGRDALIMIRARWSV